MNYVKGRWRRAKVERAFFTVRAACACQEDHSRTLPLSSHAPSQLVFVVEGKWRKPANKREEIW